MTTLALTPDTINSEVAAEYKGLEGSADSAIIKQALAILASRIREPDNFITSPQNTRDYLKLQLAEAEREHFAVLFLDNRHGVIGYEVLFHGTIDGASVHPREIVKRALQVNAAAVILAHNHPSGNPEPSQADIALTGRLKDSLALIDVRVLDHFIVGSSEPVSFSERGLI